MWGLSLVMRECSLSGHGQGHVSNFYTVDLENFATASHQYTGDIHNSVRSRLVYDTYKTMEPTRLRHGWVHMFITHRPTVTLQLHNFNLFRTCRTSSFCTVAWQLARFQLIRRIAQSSAIAELLVLVTDQRTKTVNSCQIMQQGSFQLLFILSLRQSRVFTFSGDMRWSSS